MSLFRIRDRLVSNHLYKERHKDSVKPECPFAIESLYHYTNINSAFDIIRTGKLRFVDSRCLNDPAELKEVLAILADVLEDFIEDLHITRKRLYRNLYYFFISSFSSKDEFDRMGFTDPSIYDSRCDMYVFSLSARSDHLGQWIIYGDNARGVSIGFTGAESGYNIMGCKVGEAPSTTAKICYDSAIKKAEVLKLFLQKSLDFIGTKDFDIIMWNIMAEALIFGKNESYRDEEEWRQCIPITKGYAKERGLKPSFYYKNGFRKEYFDVPYDKSKSIKSITFGPALSEQECHNLEQDFRFLLKESGFNVDDIVFSKSKIKYRPV